MSKSIHKGSQKFHIVSWNESYHDGSPRVFHDASSVFRFLQDFMPNHFNLIAMQDLLREASPQHNLSQLSDAEVIEQLAGLIWIGRFRVFPVLPEVSPSASTVGAEEEAAEEETQEQQQTQEEPAATVEEEDAEEEPTPEIIFFRNTIVCPCCGSGSGSSEETTFVSPLPASVVGRLYSYGRRPLDSELVLVRVTNGTESSAQLQSDAETITLDMGMRIGAMYSNKLVLLWYGDSADLNGAEWDDIALLDISASGGMPFCTQVQVTSSGVSTTLGVCDVLMEDPDASGSFRSARYGIFRTRTPHLKFVCHELDTSQISVYMDDGENETEDELNVTQWANLSGEDTDLSDVPGWVQIGSQGVTGTTNTETGRKRLYQECVDAQPEDGDCALFMFGENRIQLYMGDEVIFCSHSFHYLDNNETVSAGYYDIERVTEEGDYFEVARSSLLLDFKDTADNAAISSVLHALRMRPRSFTGHYGIVEAKSHDSIDYQGLVALRDEIEGFGEEELESIGISQFSPVDLPDESGILEKIPEAFHSDFTIADHTFSHASLHWHHFVIHTFPALRLIEHIILPSQRPAMVAISGVQFETNKTFIRPGVVDGVRRILELNDEDPDRKIAIFGHTDTVGTEGNNNELSIARAQSIKALFQHTVGWWYDRFERRNDRISSRVNDIQFALTELGLYTGPIDGVETDDYRNSLHQFQSNEGIPEGSADSNTRTRMATRILEQIGATGVNLQYESRWGTRELQSMLKHLGHYNGDINGSMTAETRTAVRAIQGQHHLYQDGDPGLLTYLVTIRDYMENLVNTALDDARFHPNAVFGCGEAYPRVPTADGVDSPQNRRVEVVFRRTAIEPIDPTQMGAACPYLDWMAPEQSGDRPPEIPSIVVSVTDTGFGGGNDFRGEQLTQNNRLLIKGERWVRPTDVTGANAGNPHASTEYVNGDLRNLLDASGHGTAVATCMGADGVGDQVGGADRTFNNFVIGTAPHVKIRPIQTQNNFHNNLRELELIASDPDVIVHSTSCHLYRNATPQEFLALEERLQDMVMQGKVAIASAGNYRTWLVGEYDTATREFGSQAPDRRHPRSAAAYNGNEEHRRRVLIVGSSAQVGHGAGAPLNAPGQRDIVANHTYLGEQVGIHTPGEDIRALSPTASAIGAPGAMSNRVVANTMAVGGIGGTSFATPMTAGIVAELMLLDSDLTQANNLARALEYVEATADPLPDVDPAGGSGAPGHARSADPGANAGGPPAGPQSPTAASTYTDIRRIHYWKAVLAAINEGLSNEGRGANGAADGHFTYCTLRDDSATNWYGMEFRSWVPDAIIWFKKPDGTFVMAQDVEALMPNDRTTAVSWRTVDTYQLAANQPLPAYPWRPGDFPAARRAYYMCQMSIEKSVLQDFQSVQLHLPGVDPMDPEGAEGPPILEIQVNDRGTLRNPAGAAGAPELWKQAINTFVVFDDFVFHMTATPQPLDHFVFHVQDNRDTVGVGEEVRVLLYAVDRFGNITDPGAVAVNVTHNGTAGSAGPNNGVFLNGNPAPLAGVAPNFGAGTDPAGLARLRFQDFHDEVNPVRLSIDDGAGHTGTVDITVEPAGAHDSFQLIIQRRGGGASVVDDPLRAGEAFEVVVRATDSEGVLVTTFTGAVELSLVSGEMGTDGPPRRRGVHIKNNDADPFSANAFTHNFVAGDNGQHTFPAFDYTSGDLQFRARSGDIDDESREITVRAGEVNALDVLNVLTQSPQTAGNSFNVEVRAIDEYGNLVDDFEGDVTLSLVAGHGTAAATAGDGTRSGVFIGDTALAGDDTYRYVHTDGGIHSFPVTCYSVEVVRFHAAFNPPAGGAAITGDSADVDIQATAVDHFSFEASGADRAGTAFQLTVTAMDASNNRVTNYADTVTLSLLQGTAYAAGPPQRGVLIETAPGNASNNHAYVASDHGSFTFRITPYTAETIQFRARDAGGRQSDGSNIVIEGSVIDHFRIQIPAAIQRNTNFNVTVTAQDANNNTVQGFIGTVNLQVRRGAGAFGAITGPNSYTFTAADNGTHAYNNVRITTDGANHVIRATDGNITSDTSPFNVAP